MYWPDYMFRMGDVEWIPLDDWFNATQFLFDLTGYVLRGEEI